MSLPHTLSPAEAPAASPVAPKNILIATDFSECSERALSYATGAARRYGSTLHLAHVVPINTYYLAGPDALGVALDQAQREAAALVVRLQVEKQLAGVEHHAWVLRGYVAETLGELIARQHVDLVVVGTHGRTGLSKLVLGSVAEEVFRKAPCPVLTVGPHVPAARPGSGLPALLFATDFSADSARALPYALSAAREFGSELTLLHVLEPGEEMGGDRGGRDARLQARLQEMLGSEAGKVRARTEIAGGDPAERIVKAAGQRGAGLIVLGLKAPQMFADRLPWLYAYRIVSQAPCPVLTVRGNVAEPAG
ncbi:MAG TPA: universal stress protein [Terriglobales bacterium]|nr:universal stress protein [Terriglobales bacterium]